MFINVVARVRKMRAPNLVESQGPTELVRESLPAA